MWCGGASPYDLPERASARRGSVVGKAGRCQRRPGPSWIFPIQHPIVGGTQYVLYVKLGFCPVIKKLRRY